LIPSLARSPFLFSPLIRSNKDFAALWNGEQLRRPRSLAIQLPRGGRRSFEPDFTLTLRSEPGVAPSLGASIACHTSQ
jgi:hypothetical protein